ncbi:MAG: Magnesium transporter [Parcubacteria group bacterium]|nr:Magnesium transporter [Parcubacteria group bacterium]
MITRHERGNTTWIDLESPTSEELAGIMQEFNIDPRIEEEIISPTPYPLTISAPEYLYIILHFPTAESKGETRIQEVDFIIGKNFLITSRYETIESIYNLHKVFEAEELLGIPEKGSKTAELLERVMRRLYAAISSEAEQSARMLERIEKDIFAGKERQTVRTISEAGRSLLRFETTLTRHEEPLNIFLTNLGAPEFFGKQFVPHAAHIEAERKHAAALVSSYRAVATELRVTNDSLLSSSQNQVMKTFTVMAVGALPLTLVASIFGMNVIHMPFTNDPIGFWKILCIMAIAGILSFTFFRLKRWL